MYVSLDLVKWQNEREYLVLYFYEYLCTAPLNVNFVDNWERLLINWKETYNRSTMANIFTNCLNFRFCILTCKPGPSCNERSRDWARIWWLTGNAIRRAKVCPLAFPDYCGRWRKMATICNRNRNTLNRSIPVMSVEFVREIDNDSTRIAKDFSWNFRQTKLGHSLNVT